MQFSNFRRFSISNSFASRIDLRPQLAPVSQDDIFMAITKTQDTICKLRVVTWVCQFRLNNNLRFCVFLCHRVQTHSKNCKLWKYAQKESQPPFFWVPLSHPYFFLEAQHTDQNFSYLRQVIKTLNPFSPKSAVKSIFFKISHKLY